ncbi:MAG: chitobiase/beta-hexosaminidase C-terminal domain-containing protein [Silvibacterium sp.]
MRLAVFGFSCLLILAGCSTGNAKYGNPVTPPSATAAPVFSPAAGSYNSVQTVSITDTTAGAAIYFTTDGTVPTGSSTAYTGPIKVSSTETLMAAAIAPGYISSTVATAAYTISPPPATAAPVFSPAAGSYNSLQMVSITDTTAGAAIYFTTNGTVPTASSTAYAGPIKVSSTETLMAVAIAPGYALSTVATSAYTISLAPDGKVLHGNAPVSGAHVYLLAANTNGYRNPSVSLLNSALTGASDMLGGYVTTANDGSFTISGMYQCTPNTQVYAYALGGNAGSGDNAASGLLAVLGNCPQAGSFTFNSPLTMNEVTTVATAYVMAGFANDATHVSSSGTSLAQTGIANAFANAVNLADNTGAALVTTPAGNGAVPQSEINTLANMLAACVGLTSSNSCSTLFETATADGTPNSTQPTDTATAAINIAHHPGANVAELYTLGTSASVFTPALSAQLNDFSVAVNFSVPNSMWAANSYPPFMGAHQLAVDASGNIWIPGFSTSTAYGLMKLSSLGAVLSPPNGYMGGGLLNPYGVAIDPSGNVWVTDPVFATSASVNVSEFSNAGVPLSPSTGFAPNNPQLGVSIAIDAQGNAWLPYVGGVAELSPAGEMVTANPGTPGREEPQGIAIDANDNVWIATGFPTQTGFFAEFSSSGAAINPPTLGQYSCGAFPNAEAETEGVAIDASGSLWLVNSEGFVKEGVAPIPPCSGAGGGFVYQIEDRGGDVAIDGDGNAWVISGVGGIGTLSEFSNSGAPISPSNGFVGIPYEPITLNGFATVSFVDLAPDSSGNLWVIQQLYTGDYSHQMPYTLYAKEFIGISAPVVTPLSAGVKNHTLGSRP